MIWITKLYIWIHLSGLSPDCQWARGGNFLCDRCRWKYCSACGVCDFVEFNSISKTVSLVDIRVAYKD